MIPINSIETGRVEKGEKSKQKFTEVEMDFEKNYISSTIIQILPESRKPVETKDIFNKKTGEINFKNDPTKNKKSKTSGNWPHQYENDTDGIIELIKKLADLHSAGILTDEEFSEKKSELLSKI
jgi:flagellar hook assembly protein FlgD